MKPEEAAVVRIHSKMIPQDWLIVDDNKFARINSIVNSYSHATLFGEAFAASSWMGGNLPVDRRD
jgi:hypothetical protein